VQQYLENGARYDQSYYWSVIGSRIWAFDWHQDRWPLMTLNCCKVEFYRNFAWFRVFGRQQQLNNSRSICVKLLHKHDKLTQCCRAFTLALARVSCSSYDSLTEVLQTQSCCHHSRLNKSERRGERRDRPRQTLALRRRCTVVPSTGDSLRSDSFDNPRPRSACCYSTVT